MNLSDISAPLRSIPPGERVFTLPRETSLGTGGFYLKISGAELPIFIRGDLGDYQGFIVGEGKFLVCAPTFGVIIIDVEAAACSIIRMPYRAISINGDDIVFRGISHPLEGIQPDGIAIGLSNASARLLPSQLSLEEPRNFYFEKLEVRSVQGGRVV